MESCSAIGGCQPHEYDGTLREAGPTVLVMSPLKALMLAEALIHSVYGLLMLAFLCY